MLKIGFRVFSKNIYFNFGDRLDIEKSCIFSISFVFFLFVILFYLLSDSIIVKVLEYKVLRIKNIKGKYIVFFLY